MDITERFSDAVIAVMREAILNAGGNEVFFTGAIDSKGLVVSVTAAARGNERSVPVNLNEMRECSVLIHNHPNGILLPSEADLGVASHASENAQGFYIVNNDVNSVYVVMEPVKPKVIKKLDVEDAAFYLSDGGPLSFQSKSFEERLVQIELLKKIVYAFNENSIGVFEAGTGVGKSYAYLIPSMLWAAENSERVVISTGTINLQQQLSEKDIPAAEKIIGKKIKTVLVKGRQNFICLRRLEDIANDRDMFSEDTETIDKIAEWAKTSPTGSRSDLPFMPPENVWSRLCSESDACMGMRCVHREKCFVMRVRKDAAGANLLIVNHHLLFADIESRMSGIGYDDAAVLPPYRRLIFDEAHDIESSATSFFSASLTRFRLMRLLNRLYRKKRNSLTGYLFTLQALSSAPDETAHVIESIESVKNNIADLEKVSFDLLLNEHTLRLNSSSARSFGPVIALITNLGDNVAAVCAFVRDIMEGIDDNGKENSQYWETRNILRRLDDITVFCKNFSAWEEQSDTVFWLQRLRISAPSSKSDESSQYIQFVQTPLDISFRMASGVFEPMKTVVCTSATLSVGKKFDFWNHRTGVNRIDDKRLLTGEFPSPFPYRTNMLFSVISDAPFPDSMSYQNFVDKAVVRMIKAAGGRTLILFTSYDSLKKSCDYARAALKSSGITVFKQGEDDRFRLLENFKKDTTSVLFATDSFRQGIDVPGESLSQVIIVKLPFSVPNDPVFAARSELIEQRGGSSFMDLSVPEAIIKFRQGIGRLIRRSDDRGCVVVFDRRIMEKPYGRLFMSSIPETKCIYAPLEESAERVERFLDA
ncbi:helicase [Treponema parvum]|uniref:Helicase n=1 Tax=Treponema parvum TaxID=138851 RepID=A0A975F2Y5_9SPIR|nr:helicase C-terminal domain-containing protein [Treponema parvum]QTQ13670.1 helicase [Treponema parvum]